MSTKHWDGLAIAAIGGAAAASAALYDALPARVATHFDWRGTPDGWMARPLAASFIPGFALVLWAALRLAPRVVPASGKRALGGGTVMPFVAALVVVFMALVHVVILRVAIGPGIDVTRAVHVLVGVLFVALGLVLPRVRRNRLVGVRTPWTLRSDENWARTHRIGGYAMVIGGIFTLLAGIAGGPAGSVVALASLVAAATVPAVYSFVIARRTEGGG
jgi:uncharacterized membrane protein